MNRARVRTGVRQMHTFDKIATLKVHNFKECKLFCANRLQSCRNKEKYLKYLKKPPRQLGAAFSGVKVGLLER